MTVTNTTIGGSDQAAATANPAPVMSLAALSSLITGVEKPEVFIGEKGKKRGDISIMQDGMYRIFSSPIGDFFILKDEFKNKLFHLPEGKVTFTPNPDFPKIPGRYYKAICDFYKTIYATNKNEVMAQIWWDKELKEFFIEVPVQRVAAASISFDKTGPFYDDPNKVLVVTSHSHHTMGAFYSGTDKSDEAKHNGIYSFVFGGLKINPDGTYTNTTVQRCVYDKYEFLLQLSDIFDLEDPLIGTISIPESEYSKVTAINAAPKYPSHLTGYSYGKTGSNSNVKKGGHQHYNGKGWKPGIDYNLWDYDFADEDYSDLYNSVMSVNNNNPGYGHNPFPHPVKMNMWDYVDPVDYDGIFEQYCGDSTGFTTEEIQEIYKAGSVIIDILQKKAGSYDKNCCLVQSFIDTIASHDVSDKLEKTIFNGLMHGIHAYMLKSSKAIDEDIDSFVEEIGMVRYSIQDCIVKKDPFKNVP
jgi:hypothetical protein